MKLTANQVLFPLSPQQADKGNWPQLLRIMKLITILILVACLHTSANGIAQQTITFSGKEVSLENVFNAIKKQTNYRFFFNTDMLQHASKITIDVKNAQVEQVMTMALKDQPLTFAIKGRTIFIMKKKEDEKKSVQVEVTGDPITVSGRVTDENGAPARGVNVTVKGTNKGTTTNIKGEFELKDVSEGAILLLTSVGYDRQEVLVKNKTLIITQLKVAIGTLDELQVIAYGTTSKRFNTGNVATIKSSDIEKQPVTNPLLTLQGRVPGLIITQGNGLNGGPVTVRVGSLQNSIGNGNDPLIVVDGVPFPSDMPRTGVEGSLSPAGSGNNPSPLNFINPSDIESISVLKDADATAIYGSRAANGALLITTKKGKPGRNTVSFNLQQGWSKAQKNIDMMNTRQYLDMRYEAYLNDGIDWKSPSVTANDLKLWDTTRYTDWWNELVGGTGKYTNINASISGGTSALQYLIGTTYRKSMTVFPGDFSDQQGVLHFNISSASTNKKLKVQLSGSYLTSENRVPGFDLTEWAIRMAPNAPALYNSDGSLNWELNQAGNSTWTNPLTNVLYKDYNNNTKNLISNLSLSYTILPGLDIRSNFGYTNTHTDDYIQTPLLSFSPQNRATSNRIAIYGNRKLTSWIVEPQLSYNKKVGDGVLDALIGFSVQQNKNLAGNIRGEGYASDDVMKNPLAATNLTYGQLNYIHYKYNGFFGRLNYILKQKYIINLAARRDGSSRFGDKNKFHNFASVGAGWIFTEEKYIKNGLKFLSFGKFRVSYGTTGNDQINDYSFLSLYGVNNYTIPYQSSSSISANRHTNPYLQWEETKKYQGGVDIGFLNDRFVIGVTYSHNTSSNQLLSYPLPSFTGFTSVTDNFNATVQNSSWEFSINLTNIRRKEFSWTTSANLTIPKNKLTAFPDIESSSYSNTLIIGKPLDIRKAYRSLGVDPTSGLYIFQDINGNPTSTPSTTTDRFLLISQFQKFYGGLNNSITYKGFQLDFIFQFVKQIGNPILFNNGSSVAPGGVSSSGSSNMPVTLLERWQKPGDNTSIQRYSTSITASRILSSDANNTDASYIRLKNVSISWRIPDGIARKIKMQNAKIYFQGQNLLTITNYRGLDPESQGNTVLPPLKTSTIGMQISL